MNLLLNAFLILFFTAGFSLHKPGEPQNVPEPSVPSIELCKLEKPPHTWDIHSALDNFTLNEDQAGYENFLEIASTVRGFVEAFLQKIPLNCDRSKVLVALKALDEDSDADNRIDATIIYIKKLKAVLREIRFFATEDSRDNIDGVWYELDSLMAVYYPEEGCFLLNNQ